MSEEENYALWSLRKTKQGCEAAIKDSEDEIARLNSELSCARLAIQQKAAQLADLNTAIEKLDRA